ncbi:FAD-dependent oxidoreductase, partial [Streptococcus pneumoniae]
VRTTRGNFSYQKLILATGATPMLPPSLPAEYVWRVNHIDMFAKLQAKLIAKPNQHITIIGAGMIGTE